jgi:pyruvate kinase
VEKRRLLQIQQTLADLESTMQSDVMMRKDLLSQLHPARILSATNLVHYLSLRNRDIRTLQDQLHILGLSSIASSESHVLAQLQAIQQRLGRKYKRAQLSACTYEVSRTRLNQTATTLFGEKNNQPIPYIMVTLDPSQAGNYSLIKNLLLNGMQVARINCAHDDEAAWSRTIYELKRAMRFTGRPCKIYMDLAGPKIRTVLLNKGRKKGKAKVEEGKLIWLAYKANGFKPADIVISPDEPGILSALKQGDRIYIDDGMIKGEVEALKTNAVAVRIVRVSSAKRQIKNDKGINFPDTEIAIDSLTAFDKACLPFMCKHADLIGYSFVRRAADLANLQTAMRELTDKPPHLIIKIETPEAVQHLPSLLLQGMRQEAFGVMIARGDLAVEIGFERMGEIQEEILWICEAAHTPVVWATQVLENLNKSGVATRSEITDAAHAAMAECVMINKGENTLKVLETLQDVLQRTGGHHLKKRFVFRPLSIAQRFLKGSDTLPDQTVR